jgi:hypothetical protein
MLHTHVALRAAQDAVRTSKAAGAPGRSRRPRWFLAMLALIGWSSLLPLGTAEAGSFVTYLCQGPSAAPVGTSGLQEQLMGEAQFVFGEGLCVSSGQQVTLQLGPYPGGYLNLQGGDYVYATPPGVSISAYSLRVSAYAAPCPVANGHCPGGVGQVFIDHTGESDPHYDFRDLGEGLAGPTTVTVSGLHAVNVVMMAATCDGTCPAQQLIASFSIPQGQFSLVDSTVPKILGSSGPADGAGPLAGVAEWTFTASDAGGSGIYGVIDAVDGRTLGERVLDENVGLCKNLGGSAERVFSSPQPCRAEVTGSVALNTNDLPDGEHKVRLYVDTAAGENADVFNARLTTANGPIVDEAPTVSGVPQVGSTLDATNASFALRAEQDWASPESGRWERCSAASICQPIAGATGPAYVPTEADVGHELVYESVATARVTDAVAPGLLHSSTADSVPTLAVTEAGGSGSSCRGPCPALAGSQLGDGGRWRITLSVAPRKVHRGTKIRLAGRVETAPRPSAGKLVYLEARNVGVHAGLVHGSWRKRAVYGRWIPFMALRATPNGAFSTSYRFRLGGRHTYQFRALAPAEGQFTNATGSSPIVAVRET